MVVTNANDLRPTNFETYIGQQEVMNELKVFVKSAQIRDCSIGHLLFSGGAGLGKTTVAQVVANEVGSRLHFITAPNMMREVLKETLVKLDEGDVLFIDEIHRLNIRVEEVLYSAIEDFVMEMSIKTSRGNEIIDAPLPKFTLIGATTRLDLVSRPLRTRFQRVFKMRNYDLDSLSKIVANSASKLEVNITNPAAREIAKRSRGVPRIANQLLTNIRDHFVAKGLDEMCLEQVCEAFDSMGIDSVGLNYDDRLYLEALSRNDRPVGLNSLATYVDEAESTVEEVIEPYLLRIGFINRTKGGRMITDEGLRHLYNTSK